MKKRERDVYTRQKQFTNQLFNALHPVLYHPAMPSDVVPPVINIEVREGCLTVDDSIILTLRNGEKFEITPVAIAQDCNEMAWSRSKRYQDIEERVRNGQIETRKIDRQKLV